jgi:signal transduction histidine kinase
VSAPVIPPSPSEGPPYLRTAFLERVTHELRGPVGVTSGALDEIEGALGADAEAVRKYFLMARRGIGRVLRVAERLQRTAQLERGTIEWAKVPTDMRGLVAEAVKEAESLEARRAVRVEVSASEQACRVVVDIERVEVSASEQACRVVVDIDWVRAAIEEIVTNAIRFARSGVSIRTEVSTDEVRVTITDDGSGFSHPPVPRFDPPVDKRGIGLSLPLVYDVIAAHGGRIEIDRSPTTGNDAVFGARVVLVLPVRKGATQGSLSTGPEET